MGRCVCWATEGDFQRRVIKPAPFPEVSIGVRVCKRESLLLITVHQENLCTPFAGSTSEIFDGVLHGAHVHVMFGCPSGEIAVAPDLNVALEC